MRLGVVAVTHGHQRPRELRPSHLPLRVQRGVLKPFLNRFELARREIGDAAAQIIASCAPVDGGRTDAEKSVLLLLRLERLLLFGQTRFQTPDVEQRGVGPLGGFGDGRQYLSAVLMLVDAGSAGADGGLRDALQHLLGAALVAQSLTAQLALIATQEDVEFHAAYSAPWQARGLHRWLGGGCIYNPLTEHL